MKITKEILVLAKDLVIAVIATLIAGILLSLF